MTILGREHGRAIPKVDKPAAVNGVLPLTGIVGSPLLCAAPARSLCPDLRATASRSLRQIPERLIQSPEHPMHRGTTTHRRIPGTHSSVMASLRCVIFVPRAALPDPTPPHTRRGAPSRSIFPLTLPFRNDTVLALSGRQICRRKEAWYERHETQSHGTAPPVDAELKNPP